MIKTAILWVTLIFLSKPLFADTTEVIIIGTVHYETDNFTPDSLYNIFTKITPNVILLESDASYLTEDFKLRPGYEDIANETKAVTKYLMNSNPCSGHTISKTGINSFSALTGEERSGHFLMIFRTYMTKGN